MGDVLTVDLPTLLSLLLALFSIALSALFYFKATDSSNAFYDNTYKFTKDIAELLVKIESGFGERLKNLDEGYSSMRNYLQNIPHKAMENVENTKEKLESEKKEVEKVLAERNKIVQKLIAESQLNQDEKEKILSQLKEKEDALKQAQREVEKLNRRIVIERIQKKKSGSDFESIFLEGIEAFTLSYVIDKMGGIAFVRVAPIEMIRRKFDRIANELPHQYIDDLERHGFFNDGLTPEGASLFKKVAAKKGT